MLLHRHHQQTQQIYHVIKLFLRNILPLMNSKIQQHRILRHLFKIIIIHQHRQLIEENDRYQMTLIHQNDFVHYNLQQVCLLK